MKRAFVDMSYATRTVAKVVAVAALLTTLALGACGAETVHYSETLRVDTLAGSPCGMEEPDDDAYSDPLIRARAWEMYEACQRRESVRYDSTWVEVRSLEYQACYRTGFETESCKEIHYLHDLQQLRAREAR